MQMDCLCWWVERSFIKLWPCSLNRIISMLLRMNLSGELWKSASLMTSRRNTIRPVKNPSKFNSKVKKKNVTSLFSYKNKVQLVFLMTPPSSPRNIFRFYIVIFFSNFSSRNLGEYSKYFEKFGLQVFSPCCCISCRNMNFLISRVLLQRRELV